MLKSKKSRSSPCCSGEWFKSLKTTNTKSYGNKVVVLVVVESGLKARAL